MCFWLFVTFRRRDSSIHLQGKAADKGGCPSRGEELLWNVKCELCVPNQSRLWWILGDAAGSSTLFLFFGGWWILWFYKLAAFCCTIKPVSLLLSLTTSMLVNQQYIHPTSNDFVLPVNYLTIVVMFILYIMFTLFLPCWIVGSCAEICYCDDFLLLPSPLPRGFPSSPGALTANKSLLWAPCPFR